MQIRGVRSTGRGDKAKGRGSKCFHIFLIFDYFTNYNQNAVQKMNDKKPDLLAR